MLKMYVLVRRDLEGSHRTVQACHAVADFVFRHGADPQVREWAEDHRTMVVLGVRDQAELEQWEQKLGGMGLETESFVEPDRNDEKTALAVAPMADGAPFKELRLL